jgi:hypothetical protein
MNRIYISGKITGLPKEEVFEKFDTAEKKLAAQGFEVVNPIKNGLLFEADWNEHMKKDIQQLLTCDFLYLLPDWKNSKGAKLEKKIAESLNMKQIIEKINLQKKNYLQLKTKYHENKRNN